MATHTHTHTHTHTETHTHTHTLKLQIQRQTAIETKRLRNKHWVTLSHNSFTSAQTQKMGSRIGIIVRGRQLVVRRMSKLLFIIQFILHVDYNHPLLKVFTSLRAETGTVWGTRWSFSIHSYEGIIFSKNKAITIRIYHESFFTNPQHFPSLGQFFSGC